MTLKIYGVASSRAARALWAAEELGLSYEHVKTPFSGGAPRTPEMLKINPNGRIPVIDDDGVIVWESMAINLYLAKKAGGALAPKDIVEDSQMTMWSIWAMTECEKAALQILFHRVVLPEDKRDERAAQDAIATLRGPLGVLESALKAGGGQLVGGRFTMADLNVAAVLSWSRPARDLYADFPGVTAWLKACLDRPAQKKVQGMR
jgi:glutathione S-transferase